MTVNGNDITIEIGASSEQAESKVRSLTGALKECKSVLNGVWNNPMDGIGGKGARSAASGFDTARKKAGMLATTLNSLKRIAFYRAIRSAIKAIGKVFEEGAQNAYWYSKQMGGEIGYIASAFDKLSSTGFTMSNQLGAAFATLKAIIAPILIEIINLVTRAAEAITQFFAILGGKSTYLKAVDYTKQAYKNTAGGAAAAKEWKNQLMGFDEINRLNEPSNGGGGGGGAANAYDQMFEEAKTNMKWVEELKKITMDWWKDLNLDPLINSWERLKSAVATFIGIVDGALYWAYVNVLLPFGKWTIEKGLPAIIENLAAAFELLNAILEKLSPVFQELWNDIMKPFITWIGEKFLDAVNQGTETLESLRKKVEEANTLGEFIQSLDGKETILFSIATGLVAVTIALKAIKIGSGIIDKLGKAFKLLVSPAGIAFLAISALVAVGILLYQKFETVRQKFDAVGEKFTEFKERFKEPAYWAELGTAIVEALSTAIGAAVGAIGSTMVELASDLVSKVKQSIKEHFYKDIDGDGETSYAEIGFNIIKSIFIGIDFAIRSVDTFIRTHIINPFVAGFKDSGETFINVGKAAIAKVEEGWDSLSENAFQIIATVKDNSAQWWADVKLWWTEKANTAVEFFADIRDDSSLWWLSVRNWWGAKVGAVSEFTTNVKDSSVLWWSNVKLWWGQKVGVVSEFWTDVRDDSTLWWSKVTRWWYQTATTALNFTVGVINNIQTLWNQIKGWWNSVASGGLWTILQIKLPTIGVEWRDWFSVFGQNIQYPVFTVSWNAKGGIFDDPTLIGVGEAGKEAVVPLERNTGWITTLADQLSERGGFGDGSTTDAVEETGGEIVTAIYAVGSQILSAMNSGSNEGFTMDSLARAITAAQRRQSRAAGA